MRLNCCFRRAPSQQNQAYFRVNIISPGPVQCRSSRFGTGFGVCIKLRNCSLVRRIRLRKGPFLEGHWLCNYATLHCSCVGFGLNNAPLITVSSQRPEAVELAKLYFRVLGSVEHMFQSVVTCVLHTTTLGKFRWKRFSTRYWRKGVKLRLVATGSGTGVSYSACIDRFVYNLILKRDGQWQRKLSINNGSAHRTLRWRAGLVQ